MIGTRIGTRIKTRVFGSPVRSAPVVPPNPVRLGWRSSGSRLGPDPAFGQGEVISSTGGSPPSGGYYPAGYFPMGFYPLAYFPGPGSNP